MLQGLQVVSLVCISYSMAFGFHILVFIISIPKQQILHFIGIWSVYRKSNGMLIIKGINEVGHSRAKSIGSHSFPSESVSAPPRWFLINEICHVTSCLYFTVLSKVSNMHSHTTQLSYIHKCPGVCMHTYTHMYTTTGVAWVLIRLLDCREVW